MRCILYLATVWLWLRIIYRLKVGADPRVSHYWLECTKNHCFRCIKRVFHANRESLSYCWDTVLKVNSDFIYEISADCDYRWLTSSRLEFSSLLVSKVMPFMQCLTNRSFCEHCLKLRINGSKRYHCIRSDRLIVLLIIIEANNTTAY